MLFDVVGAVSAFLAAVFFGVMYIPVKQYETFDGSGFQWLMSVGILAVGLMYKGLHPTTSLITHGITSGILWALSNIFVIPAVRLLGLGVGFAFYHCINLILGYSIGRFGLFGAPMENTTNPLIKDIGLIFLFFSLVLMIRVEPSITRSHTEQASSPTESTHLLSKQALPKTSNTLPNNKPLSTRIIHRVSGILAGIFAGVLAGLNMLPFDLYQHHHPDTTPEDFIFSQSLGVFVTASIYLEFMLCTVTVRGNRLRIPSVAPALLCGTLWAVGQIFQTIAIKSFGMTQGYVYDAVGPVMISAGVAFFVFREISGRKSTSFFAISLALQVIGVVCITIG